MTLGSYFLFNFGHLDLTFDPLLGFSVKIAAGLKLFSQVPKLKIKKINGAFKENDHRPPTRLFLQVKNMSMGLITP